MSYEKSFTDERAIVFYHWKNTTCYAKVVLSNNYNKRYVGISKESEYETKDGENKRSNNNLLLTLPAAKQLLEHLPNVIEALEQLDHEDSKQAATGVHHKH